MTSKEKVKYLWLTIANFYGEIEPLESYQEENKIRARKCCEHILQDLERSEKLEKIFSDSHICEIQERFKEIKCSADKCENCPLGFESGVCLKNTFEHKWKLQEENQELKEENQNLKKALDKACEMLEWGCPVEQDLIDDLDCENCKSTEKECWKKYFLNEVL